MERECPNEELLAAYLDGALDTRVVDEVRAHVETCATCLGLLAEVVEDPEQAQPEHEGFDRYVLGRRLGAGAMGVVHEAFDPELKRKVAIKLVRASAGPDRAADHARMLREAQAMARLAHPNLVPVLAVGTRDDELYLVMELIEGPSLRAWITAAPHDWREVLRAYVAAGRGLAAAHAAGVVHRDFKPDNVLVGAQGGDVAARVRVIDFGLARLVGVVEPVTATLPSGSERLERTAAGVLLGTPAYMAPEQRIDAAVDARADQFALAVSLWEGLFGERPFAGRTHSALQEAIESGKLQRPSTRRGVPVRVVRALERALAAKPELRFADMTAFVDALEQGTRRRQGWIAVAAALGGTAVASALVIGSDPQLACTPRAAPRWDEAARTRLRDAFVPAGHAIAGASTTVISALDRRVAAWHDAYALTCADPEASAAVRTCLDVRRLELDAVVDVIAEGDTDVLARALPMVAGLPGVEPCTRSPARLARVDPQLLVGEAQQLREQLAVARALGDAGRYDDAIATAQPVLERAAEIGHAAVHAEANARLGILQVAASAPAEGATLLEEAFFEAREIGHDEVATESSIALVAALGGQLARIEAVAPWVEHAEAALQRWGSRELEAALEKARGGIALRTGDNEDAIARYARTVEILGAALEPDDPRLADAIDALGLAEQVAQKWELALAHHERALVMREHAYGDAHPDVGYSLTNIARALIEQGLEEPAIHHNEWVIAIDEAALGSEHLFTAIAHNNLGAAWGRLGEPAAAAEEFQAARPGFERLGADHPDVAIVLSNIGQAALETGDYATAAEMLEQALAIRERHFGPEHPATRACAGLLGATAASVGAHGRAVASIERALAGAGPPAGYAPIELVQLRITLAQSLLALRRRDEAIAVLAVAREEIARIDDVPPRIVADADELARAL